MKGIRDQLKEAHHSRPDVIIGKRGVTREVIREISKRLKKKKIIKIKMLKTAVSTARERRELAKHVAELVNAELMGIRGRTFILYKEQRQDLLLRRKRPNRSWMR